MLVIRDYERFCNRIASDVGIDRSCGIVQDAVKDALRFYGNASRFYGGRDNEFLPPAMMEGRNFLELCIGIDTIADAIRNDVEWEVRTGRDVIGAKSTVTKRAPQKFKKLTMSDVEDVDFVKKVNDEHREKELDRIADARICREGAIENVAQEAVNEARDLRQQIADAACEMKRLRSVNDNLQQQTVARNKELKDAINDMNPYMHVLLYEYAWSDIRNERDALYRVIHLGIAEMDDVYRAFEYISGLLDGLSAKDMLCMFVDCGGDETSITWKNYIEGISTIHYTLTVEAAPTSIAEDDVIGSSIILDKFMASINRETFVYSEVTS